jgi:hypothetical protein
MLSLVPTSIESRIAAPISSSRSSKDPVSSIRLSLREISYKYATHVEITQRYQAVILVVLESYLGRVLTYDSDILNAFSGIINGEAHTLEPFHGGLPKKLFSRALISGHTYPSSCNRRPEFPTWSWLG